MKESTKVAMKKGDGSEVIGDCNLASAFRRPTSLMSRSVFEVAISFWVEFGLALGFGLGLA